MFPPFLIQIIGVLLIAGLLLWGLGKLPWFDADVKQVIRVVVVVVLGIWLIYLLMGVLGGGTGGSHAWPFRG